MYQRGAGDKVEENRRNKGRNNRMPVEMRYLNLSKFVEIENEFFKGKEDKLELILDLLKKDKNL